MTNARLDQADPTAADLAAFQAWKNTQLQSDGLLGAPAPVAAAAPAPAPVAAPAPVPVPQPSSAPSPAAGVAFRLGQIVDTPQGVAVVISVNQVARVVPTVDVNGTVTGQQSVEVPGYRVAYLPNAVDSHSTEQELGLKAL